MDCKRCLRNGLKREGGVLGLCWTHQNRKCQICGFPSDGEELCTNCLRRAEIQRMASEANLLLIDPDDNIVFAAIRRERLCQAKFHAHRAVEVLFRGLVLSLEALWGDIEKSKVIEPPHKQFKKAA